MTCYVDKLCRGTVQGARAKEWCHLIADSLEELHEMAKAIGMRRAWFQGSPPASFPHYDLVPSRRATALKRGAIELPRAHFVSKLRELRRLPEYSRATLPERAS